MLRARIIPVLLLRHSGLVKSVQFKNHRYVGDPLNAVRIFNEKEVDELILIDIEAGAKQQIPSLNRIRDIASECFMPVCYGGGIRTLEDIRSLFRLGMEKVSINTMTVEAPELIMEAAAEFGSQSIVASIDVKKSFPGRHHVFTHCGTVNTGINPVDHARRMEERGAGEILLTSIDRDGMMNGYDTALIQEVAHAVTIPVIACGGAGSPTHCAQAIRAAGAHAAAAGSCFVFYGKHKAVLINYPSSVEMELLLQDEARSQEAR